MTGSPAVRTCPPPAGCASRDRIEAAIGEMGAVDAVGHRVVHGGVEFRRGGADRSARSSRACAPSRTSRRCTSPRRWPRSTRLAPCSRTCPRWPASTPPSTRPSRMPRPPTPFPASGAAAGRCAGSASTGCRTRTRRAVRPSSARAVRSRICASSPATSARAHPWPPSRSGRSVDTTMGFTPLEGLVMATRSGSVDPGLVLWLQEHVGTPPAELAATLEGRSGLLGLAGSPDMRAVLASEAAGDPEAHARSGGLPAPPAGGHRSHGRSDGWTGRGGLHRRGGGACAPESGPRAAAGLGFLGVQVDPRRNDAGRTAGS